MYDSHSSSVGNLRKYEIGSGQHDFIRTLGDFLPQQLRSTERQHAQQNDKKQTGRTQNHQNRNDR